MSAIDEQVGGSHYKRMTYQPIELSMEVGGTPTFCKVAKYLTRDKDDRLDNLSKARHCIQLEKEMFAAKPFLASSYPHYGLSTPNVDRVYAFGRQFDNAGIYQRILLYMLDADYKKATKELDDFISSGAWSVI